MEIVDLIVGRLHETIRNGEIGLDYHWNDNREQQIAAFERQMDIARESH